MNNLNIVEKEVAILGRKGTLTIAEFSNEVIEKKWEALRFINHNVYATFQTEGRIFLLKSTGGVMLCNKTLSSVLTDSEASLIASIIEDNRLNDYDIIEDNYFEVELSDIEDEEDTYNEDESVASIGYYLSRIDSHIFDKAPMTVSELQKDFISSIEELMKDHFQ